MGSPLDVEANNRGASAVDGSDLEDPVGGGGGLVGDSGLDGCSGESDMIFGGSGVEGN